MRGQGHDHGHRRRRVIRTAALLGRPPSTRRLSRQLCSICNSPGAGHANCRDSATLCQATRPAGTDENEATAVPRRYRSRIDAIWVVLFLACAAAFLAGVVNRSANPAMSRMLLELTLCVATVFICIGVPCHYTLLDKGVRIQSGLFIREVPYGNILSVDPENGT